MVGELPERVYVPQLNKSVAVFAAKSSIPTDFYEEDVVIPEESWSQSDVDNRAALAYKYEALPSSIPHYQALGVQYPGAFGAGFVAALLILQPLILKVILYVGLLAIMAYVAKLVFSRTVEPRDTDNDGIPDKDLICTWMGCYYYDYATGNVTGGVGGFGELMDTLIFVSLLVGGAYVVFKLVLPGVADAMKSTGKEAWSFTKRGAGELYKKVK